MQLVTAIALLLALARGASAAAGDWPACPTGSQCACPAGFDGTYPACTWSATARTGATSTAKDVCAPTIETLSDTTTIQHIYHMGVKFDSTTPTPQYFFLECQSAKDVYVEHPTIMMQAGSAPKKTYFDQSDMDSPVVSSNWYHPLGFAYKYDGAHVVVAGNENPELGMADATTKDDGVTNYKYLKDGHDLTGSRPDGAWDETETAFVGGKMDADGSFIGLDSYEPQAFFSQDFWAAHKWGVDLKLEGDSSLSKADDVGAATLNDFFYFCHIHGGMNGRIKVVAGTDDLAALTNAADVSFLNTGDDTRADSAAPTVPYFPATDDEYYFPVSSGGKPATGSLDLQCGTHGIDEYSSSKTSPKCHDTFVCDIGDNVYGKCLDAMDCYMSHHMRTALHAKPEVNFFEQMIPHHINAVNMAKATLKTLTTNGAYAEPACCTGDDSLLPVLHNIINVQSQQVQYFEGVLEAARGDGVAKKACAGPDHSVSGSTAAFPASATAASAVAVAGAAAFVSSFGEL